jgi:hypothetical protein
MGFLKVKILIRIWVSLYFKVLMQIIGKLVAVEEMKKP